MLAKRAGLIFIRRSTRDDPVYPAMMRLYLGCLLKVHANLEWYFEGGRTRTGKLRPPRMGVLRYLLDAFVENLAEPGSRTDQDVYIVPVSIVYDQQHEVEAISFEDTGGSKTPESLKWLYGFARAQSTRRGQVHVRFGEPLSLLDTLEDARERAGSAEPETVVRAWPSRSPTASTPLLRSRRRPSSPSRCSTMKAVPSPSVSCSTFSIRFWSMCVSVNCR